MLTLFTDARFDPDADTRLRAGATGHRLLVSERAEIDNLKVPDFDAAAREADVLFGQPSVETIASSPRAAWVHLTTAGYARYDTAEVRALVAERSIRVTNSSTVYAVPCAEQALAAMLMLARRLDACVLEQKERSWRWDEHRRQASLLTGSRVLLLGFGAIGRALLARLSPFGVEIAAMRRHPRPEDPIPTVAPDAVGPYLERADHVVNLLPEGPATDRIVDATFLARMRPGAFFYNLGRGRTVDATALLGALASGHLGGAYLDVTDPEPLPPEDPLWSAPRLVISPHIAGGHRGEHLALVELFLENLRRFTSGEPLLDRIL